jgi:uncharacterized C2H2 Zn-finger protein
MQQTFRCPECGAEFPTQAAMEEHVSREHMGTSTMKEPAEQARKCPACSMEFPTADSLEEHERRHRSGAATN